MYRLIHKRQNAWLGLLFLALPGLGFILYYVPSMIRRLVEAVGVDRDAILTHIHDVERQREHPDVHEALDVVPVADAVAISANTEKRALLLSQLIKTPQENCAILFAAEHDEDSESAHYVAAAKMELYRIFQTQWLDARKEYEEQPDSPEAFHAACHALMELLSSDVAATPEKDVYRKWFSAMVQQRIETAPRQVNAREYEGCLRALIDLGQTGNAERFWKRHGSRMRTESAYQNMLRMFYETGQRSKFENTLQDLRRNRQVRLSPQGLEQLRYWSERLASR